MHFQFRRWQEQSSLQLFCRYLGNMWLNFLGSWGKEHPLLRLPTGTAQDVARIRTDVLIAPISPESNIKARQEQKPVRSEKAPVVSKFFLHVGAHVHQEKYLP